jgi:DNA polymerase elongation subunit (family B)
MSFTATLTKKVVGKTFRLLDFDVYDKCLSELEKGSSSSSGVSSGGESEQPTFVKREQKQFVIQMFGLNDKGETCCIYVTDYKPFFYAKVGEHWTQSTVNAFVREVVSIIGKYHESGIKTAILEEHHKLYGFSAGKKYKFMKFEFHNSTTMSKVKSIWYETCAAEPNSGAKYSNTRKLKPYRFQNTNVELYESNIPPLLRYFHIQNISPSGWIYINTPKATVPSTPLTTCTYEYVCKLSQLKSVPDKETRVPYKICSFDIEASSSHGDFPIPVKSYKRLASNIYEVLITQNISDEARCKLVIQKSIMASFGYGKMENIDLVYPKRVPSKQTVEEKIQLLLQTPVSKLKTFESEDNDAAQILTINAMFEKIKDSQNQEFVVDCDGDGDGDDSDNEYDGEYDRPRYTKSKVTKPELMICQMLITHKSERDLVISSLDEILTRLFPALKGDEVTFIGSTFLNYGEKEPYLNHCLVQGTCDPVTNVEIECVQTEKDLLIQWTDLIQRENPDIIIGYNIFGFDYEFMFRRALETNCVRDFLLLSRNNGELCAKVKQVDQHSSKSEYSIENTTVALASGEYDLKYFRMPGRLQIDMYTYFRRDYNLSSYKLDDVAGQFISDDINKIECVTDADTGIQTTHLYSGNLSGLHVDDFIHIELSGFTSDYYKDGKKFKVANILRDIEVVETVKDKVSNKAKEVTNKYNIIVIAGHEQIPPSKNIKWGMAKDDVSPQDIFRLSKGSAADRAIVAKYCIQDCNLVHHLMGKIDVLTGYVEMSRICSVPISFLVFRGQGIKLTSYVAKKCREKHTLMPDLDKSGENDGYEGAIVLPPKCSMYMDNPVACVDYSSLYPSSMISNNLSHDSKVWVKEYDLAGNLVYQFGEKNKQGEYIYDNLPGYKYVDLEFDTFKYIRKTPTSRAEKTKCGTKIVRWAQFPDDKKGIMPSILEELLKARSATRKHAKTEKDPFMQNILDKRQLGYKVTANSLYGQCGAKTSTFYEKDVAASTTATGRMMITYAQRIIEEVYGKLDFTTECHGLVRTNAEYVYGDTDSVFFTFNLTDPVTGEKIRGKKALEITIEIAQHAARLCSDYLKPPMELAYEKTLMPFILLSKKRYVGMLYETDPNKGKLKYMGLSLKRRDSCDYLKDTYGGILNILMKENNIQRAIEFLDKSITDLIRGNVSMDKLMLTKALRSDYKNPERIAHRVLADRIGKRDPGNKPKPGDRIKFVYVVNPDAKLLGEKIETPEYILSNKLKIDNVYYITNQLMKPLQQLFGLAVEQIWEFRGMKMDLRTFKKDMEKMGGDNQDLEVFMKKREKYCSAKVKTLLFDKYLIQIHNEKNKIQTLAECFGRTKK